MIKKPEITDVGWHAVLLVDVFGQKEAIARLAHLPETPEQHQKYIAAVKDSAGKVVQVRGTVREYFLRFLGTPNQAPVQLNAEQKDVYESVQETSIRTQVFSDTVIAYAPLLNSHGQLSIRGIYAMLCAAGAAMLMNLATGVAIRGAIEAGVAMELGDGDLYGPAFAEAYRLEQEVAQYPRVVVSMGLMGYLKSFHEPAILGLRANVNAGLAETCMSMISRDMDGAYFVDWAGRQFAKAFGESIRREIEQSSAFAKQEHEGFVKAENHKLALRYAWLRQYLDARLLAWGEGTPP